jgi:sec-independent protein translocase protein TatC
MIKGLLDRRNSQHSDAEMSFVDHLEELRWHIVRSLIAVAILAIACFVYIDWIFENIILGPINPNFVSYSGLCNLSHFLHIGNALCLPPMHVQLQTTAFGAQFMSSITIAVVTGFIVAFPYVFWEFWRFIKPALSPQEVRNTRGAIFYISFFFFCGVAFGYFLLAPFTFNFLGTYTMGTQKLLETKPTLDDYLENLIDLIIGCGAAFELPILSYVLAKMGLLTPGFLIKNRKFAIVVILVIAAVITPSPDWMSQTIVFIPLFLLYQLSIFVCKKAVKEDERKQKEEWS